MPKNAGESSAGQATEVAGKSPFSGAWFVVCLLILAAGVRLWILDIKPPHFDEGINGWFADGMTDRGYFVYDPTNYHGPWHFYTVWASQTLFGRSLWSLRLPAVIASVACVLGMLAFARFFGKTPARMAAIAMALSPAFVFYGRYSIHESWVVFFNILLFLGVLGLWKGGRKSDLWLISLGVAGLVLNKETYLIQIGSLLLAWPCLWLWNKIVPGADPLEWKKPSHTNQDWLAPVGIGLAAIVLFYSGTFFYPQGLHGLWQTWTAWIGTGVESGGHEKARFDLFGGPLNWYWVWLMLRYEWPAFLGLLACAGCLAPVPQHLRLAAIYAGGLLLAYSVIPYKTPWCIISFLWPFYLVLGGLIQCVPGLWKWLCWVAFAAAVLGSTNQMWRLNFVAFDDEKEPYVYVQTFRDLNKFTEPVLEAARRDPRNLHMHGQILLESYYPLPWIFGDFTSLAYFGGSGWPEKLGGAFVVADASKRDEVLGRLDGDYMEVGFRFRDAQGDSVAFLRRDVFQEILDPDQPTKNGL